MITMMITIMIVITVSITITVITTTTRCFTVNRELKPSLISPYHIGAQCWQLCKHLIHGQVLWQYGIRLRVINDLLFLNHNGDAKSPSWRLKSSASTLLVQPLVQGNSQKNYTVTASNGNIFRVTGHLCGEFTGRRGIPRTKASDADLWCFLWSASK